MMAASFATHASSARLGRLLPTHAALFVCDIQERFRPVITGMPSVIDTARRLVRGANTLGLPVLVSEQYPEKLGSTVSELSDVLGGNAPIVSKTHFSMLVPDVEEFLHRQSAIKQVLLCGIEAHVCILQTTLDLLEKGYEVHVVVDGVSSQRSSDRTVALGRMSQSGAMLCTSEMALFQLLKGAGHPQFKTISKLCTERRPDPLGVDSTLLGAARL